MDKKILIAYFSWGGNTKNIANIIHQQVGGDLFEIKTLEPYPTNYRETAYGIAKEQHENNIYPEITNTDVTPYDTIFVGTPAWWYTMAPAVKTFLNDNNFENKTIIPFITHGGGGGYSIDKDMANIANGSKVLKPIVIWENGTEKTPQEIEAWLEEIK